MAQYLRLQPSRFSVGVTSPLAPGPYILPWEHRGDWTPEAFFRCSRATCFLAPPRPGRSTTSLICNCLFAQRAGLFRSKPSISGRLPTIRHLWTRHVGDGRPVTALEVDLSRTTAYNLKPTSFWEFYNSSWLRVLLFTVRCAVITFFIKHIFEGMHIAMQSQLLGTATAVFFKYLLLSISQTCKINWGKSEMGWNAAAVCVWWSVCHLTKLLCAWLIKMFNWIVLFCYSCENCIFFVLLTAAPPPPPCPHLHPNPHWQF